MAWIVAPKCGNTSIKHAFLKSWGFREPSHQMFSQCIESNAKLHLVIPDKIPQDFFTFMFVRSPYTRALSCYVSKLVRPDNPKHFKSLKGQSFEEFLTTIQKKKPKHLDKHIRPCSFGLDNVKLDFVGHVENMEEDWDKIRKRFNSAKLPKITQENRKYSEEYQHLLTPSAKQLIEQIFHKDFELCDAQ